MSPEGWVAIAAGVQAASAVVIVLLTRRLTESTQRYADETKRMVDYLVAEPDRLAEAARLEAIEAFRIELMEVGDQLSKLVGRDGRALGDVRTLTEAADELGRRIVVTGPRVDNPELVGRLVLFHGFVHSVARMPDTDARTWRDRRKAVLDELSCVVGDLERARVGAQLPEREIRTGEYAVTLLEEERRT